MFETLTMFQQLKMEKLVFLDAIGHDPTKPAKIPEPYSMHTGFNPSKSGFIQQHLEDCGPMHNVSRPAPTFTPSPFSSQVICSARSI